MKENDEEILSGDEEKKTRGARGSYKKRPVMTDIETRDAFLLELGVRVKPSSRLGKVLSKDSVYQIFADKVVNKLDDGSGVDSVKQNILLFAVANIVSKDNLDIIDFYNEHIRDNKNLRILKSGTSDGELDFLKKFYTEFFFNENPKGRLVDRIFGENGLVKPGYAPEIGGASNIRECTWKVAYYCLEKTCGNVLLTDEHTNLTSRSQIVNDLIENNYQRIDGTNVYVKKVLVDDKSNTQTVQDATLKTYIKIVDKYLKDVTALFDPENISRETFEKRAKGLKEALSLLESRMSTDTKKKLNFINEKHLVDEYFANTDVIFESCGMKENESKLHEIFKKSLDGKSLTAEEKTRVDEFEKTIKALKKVFKSEVTQAEKKLGFFLCTKMQPNIFWSLCTSFVDSGLANDSISRDVKDVENEITKKGMFPEAAKFASCELDLEKQLRHNKGMRVISDGEVLVDLTDEKYDRFILRINEYIKANNMPNTELCHRAVGEAIIASGTITRESPAKNLNIKG